MKKYEVVKSNILFNEIIHKGKFFYNNYFIIYMLESKDFKPHFGIAVGKKNGNAVERNKIKRQIRVLIDNNKKLFKNNYNYIIMIKKDYKIINFKQKNEELIDLLRKVQNEK